MIATSGARATLSMALAPETVIFVSESTRSLRRSHTKSETTGEDQLGDLGVGGFTVVVGALAAQVVHHGQGVALTGPDETDAVLHPAALLLRPAVLVAGPSRGAGTPDAPLLVRRHGAEFTEGIGPEGRRELAWDVID